MADSSPDAPRADKLTPRLFFALVPDAAARDALAALAREIAPHTGGRAPPAANLHLTLAFLGQVPQRRLSDIEQIGERVASACSAFDVALDSVGYFRDARVAWAGTIMCAPELQRLHEALRDALAAAQLPHERRKLSPHVTLARHCRQAPPREAWSGVSWRADALTLMASESTGAGVRYRTVAICPLARPAALP